MDNRDFQYEAEVEAVVKELIDKIGANDVIADYKKIALKVDQHVGLKNLVEEIKAHQKDAVRFAHYEKFEAEKEALRLSNEKQQQFDEHPLVIDYREKLIEANDLLQHVTYLLEQNINDELEDKLTKKTEEE